MTDDTTTKKLPSKAVNVPAAKVQVPAVRGGVPIVLDKHAQTAEEVRNLSTVLQKFGERKWSKLNERFCYTEPNNKDVAALRALMPSLPRIRALWAEVDLPASADLLLAEAGMIAEGVPLANNINPKVFLANLCQVLERERATIWELVETRLAFVKKANFGAVAAVMEMFEEKRKEAGQLQEKLRKGVAEKRLQIAERTEKERRDNPEEARTISPLEYEEALERMAQGETSVESLMKGEDDE